LLRGSVNSGEFTAFQLGSSDCFLKNQSALYVACEFFPDL
jgi:hypothetical protein